MIWYYAEDKYYYESSQLEGEKLLLPSEAEIKESIRQGKDFVVVAPYLPPDHLKNLFRVVFLPNKHGVLTTQDYEYLQTVKDEDKREDIKRNILQEKVGLKIYKIKDLHLVGLLGIKRYIMSVQSIKDDKVKPKGVFLVGLPGTGKSYSAKYAAYMLNAYLVELNLSKIMESQNPVFALNSVFEYLQETSKTGIKYVIWIDEIEKMFVGEEREKRIFGQLLTILNDLNTPTGYTIDGIFWVTANNIIDIMNRNPEFLRKGRFDELFFVDSPSEDDAKEMCDFYKSYYVFDYKNLKHRERTYKDDVIDLTKNVVYAQKAMEIGAKSSERFIYVPAEIQQIAKQMRIRQELVKQYAKQKDDGVLMLLYPHSSYKVLVNYINTYYNERWHPDSYKHFLEMMKNSKYITKHSLIKTELTDIDLVTVLTQIEPLVISMRDSISKMRSQERLFTPAG